jgi:hypothetical protein
MNLLNKTHGIIQSIDPGDGRIGHNPQKKYCDKPNTDKNGNSFFVIFIQKIVP